MSAKKGQVKTSVAVVAVVVALAVGVLGGYFGSVSMAPAQQAGAARTVTVVNTFTVATTRVETATVRLTTTVTLTPTTGDRVLYDPALVEAARREGKVIMYSSIPVPQLQEFKKVFEQRFPGITLEFWRADATVVLDKIRTEYSGGVYAYDVVFATDTAVKPAYDLGYAVVPNVRLPEGFPSDLVLPYGFGIRLLAYVIIYNEQLVSAERAPKTLEDLADPRWKGKIWVLDPKTHLSAGIFHMYLMKTWGEAKYFDWIRKLKANDAVWHNVAQRVATACGTGEAEVCLAYHSNALGEALERRPVNTVWPDPTFIHPTAVAMAARPANPNAARLLIQFLLYEGMKVLQGVGELPAVIDPTIQLHKVNQGYQKVGIKVIPLVSESELAAFRQRLP
ncbi:MAG: extracellular solute-binding protein [Candidatus Caldarchaeum sp.]|nr:extracellular solute-binding protein [Candidatus Caldarchaeum sp.]